MLKEEELKIPNCETEISKFMKEMVKEHDKFIMEKLNGIKHKYAGYRTNKPEPCIFTNDVSISETPIKCDMTLQFIGFDNEKEVDYYINQGFNIFVTKDITEIIKGYNKSINNILNLEKEKEEVISSLEVEDYLWSYVNNKENTTDEKRIMEDFLREYLSNKKYYVVEFFRNKGFYIRVENSDDEIISNELKLGVEITEAKKPTVDDFELMLNSDMTINKYVNETIEDSKTSAEDKIFMIKDFIKHLNKGLFRQDAVDMFENMCQLVMDQNTNEIIDVIYY